MTWVRRAGLTLCATAIALPAIAEAGIVVASSGPSASQFPVGRKVDDNATITLRDGDSLTVLVKGSTRVLRGAGTFEVGKIGGTTRVSTFTALVRPRGATRVRPGAVRNDGTNAPVRSPNLWYLGVDQSGPFCILDPKTIRMWRPDIDAAASYRIRTGDTGMNIAFPKGEMLAAWDVRAMPVSEGADYAIESRSGASTSVTFAFLEGPPATPEEAAEALIQRGCMSQLDLLTATLESRDGGAG